MSRIGLSCFTIVVLEIPVAHFVLLTGLWQSNTGSAARASGRWDETATSGGE